MGVLKKLTACGITDIERFAKGHRSIVYKGRYKNKKVAIKIEGSVKGKIKNEVVWLKILNKCGIGPKLLLCDEQYIVYEFVDGQLLIDFLRVSDRKKIKIILKKLFFELRTLDKLEVNKKELHHPFKHIFILGNKVKMIDFERCKKSKKPKNVSQFCQFLISNGMNKLLVSKGFNIDKEETIEKLKVYKGDFSEKNFKSVLETLGLN